MKRRLEVKMLEYMKVWIVPLLIGPIKLFPECLNAKLEEDGLRISGSCLYEDWQK